MTSPRLTVVDLLRRQAKAKPGALALAVEGGVALTYDEWDQRSNVAGHALLGLGVGPGDRVALLFDNRRWTDFGVAYLAVLRAGGVAVPLTFPWNTQALERVIRDCTPAVLVSPPDLVPSGCSAPMATTADLRDADGADALQVRPLADSPAELLYVTGTLKRTTAVAFSHAAIVGRVAWYPEPVVSEGPSFLHAFALGSKAGQEALRLPLVCTGAPTATVLASPDPGGCYAALARLDIDLLGLPPFLARLMIQRNNAGARVPAVRRLVSSGHLPPRLLAQLAETFPNASFVQAGPVVPPPGPAQPERRDPPTVAPLASSQEGMLWHEQFAPGSFNMPPLVRQLTGPLDICALERTFSEIVRRHAILRTTFELTGGEAAQVIEAPRELDLPVHDLSTFPPAERESRIDELLSEAVTRPVDLVAGPLFRPFLLRLAAEDHVLVVPIQHLVLDDWSLGLLRREISLLYTAFVAGDPSPLPDPPLQFSDFCIRQRQRLDGAAGKAELAWWTSHLAGAPLSVQLPLEDPSLPKGSPQPPGQPLSLVLSPPLSADLRDLARRHRATPYITVLAAFMALLHRYTGLDDLLVASVVANRNRTELEGLIGCFAKKVLVRARLADDPTFPELMSRVRDSLLGALSHPDLPYDTVVQRVLGPRAARHGLVPQVMVMFQGLATSRARFDMAGLKRSGLDSRSIRAGSVHFTSARDDGGGHDTGPPWGMGLYLGTFLGLSVHEGQDSISLLAKGSYYAPAASALLGHFNTLLTDLVANPSGRTSELIGGLTAGGTELFHRPDVVELAGFPVEPARIEAALALCPSIRQAALVLQDDIAGERKLVAYVVAETGATPVLSEVRALLWNLLPGYAWPAEMRVVDSITGGADSKRDSSAFRSLDSGNSSADPSSGAPRTPEERLLCTLWADVRGRGVSVQSNYWQDFSFLEVADIANCAGSTIEARHISRNRTIETLAAAMAASEYRDGASRRGGVVRQAVRTDTALALRQEAEFFGQPGAMLFGSRSAGVGRPRAGLVICSPIHAEHPKNYRREVLLARGLAAKGVAVQRFHYRGAGHSDGENGDLVFDTMRDDALAAAHRLVEATGVERVGFLGTRLGGLAAAAAAAEFDGAPLVLWEPVVEPEQYFRDALRARVMAQLTKGSGGGANVEALLGQIREVGFVGVVGYSISRQLYDSLAGHHLATELGTSPRRVLLVQFSLTAELHHHYVQFRQWCEEQGSVVETAVVAEKESWWFAKDPWRRDDKVAGTSAVLELTADWVEEQLSSVTVGP